VISTGSVWLSISFTFEEETELPSCQTAQLSVLVFFLLILIFIAINMATYG